MDIRFCDICNESIAQVHFDEGRAVLRDGHVCVASAVGDPERAGPRADRAAKGGSGAEWMAATAIVVAAGLGWIAVDRAERSEADLRRTVAEERAQVAAALDEFAGGLTDLRARSADERRDLIAEFDALRGEAAGGRVRVEELATGWQGQLAALSDEVSGLRAGADAGESERLARIETSLASLRADIELLGGAMIEALDGFERGPVDGQSAGAGAADGGESLAPLWGAAAAGLDSADSMVRWDAVDQLARSGDAAAAVPLLPLLRDEDLVVRMSVARALSELGNPMAVPALIDALEDVEPPVREAAVVALRQLTGRSFRFDPVASEADRGRKVESWRRWWERSGADEVDAP